jgi:hypothetical protein
MGRITPGQVGGIPKGKQCGIYRATANQLLPSGIDHHDLVNTTEEGVNSIHTTAHPKYAS